MLPIDLTDRVAQALDRIQAQASAKSIEIALEAPSSLPTVGDPGLIDRLVWNLLDNALKFTSPGGHVEVELAALAGDVLLQVSDSGPGIQPEMRDKIFRRFQRGDASRGSAEGTGLGLAIVRAIAEAHGGSVRVDNRPTGGARFQVRLPAGGPAITRNNGVQAGA